jgi:hypothetical protein
MFFLSDQTDTQPEGSVLPSSALHTQKHTQKMNTSEFVQHRHSSIHKLRSKSDPEQDWECLSRSSFTVCASRLYPACGCWQ